MFNQSISMDLCSIMTSHPLLSMQTVMTANSIVARKSSSKSTTPAIRCAHTDPATGFNEYFVVTSSGKRGYWWPEENVDLTSLIHYRFEQRRPYLEKKEKLQRERSQAPFSKSSSNTKRKAPASAVNVSLPPAKKINTSDVFFQKGLEFQAACNKHAEDTCRLLKASAAAGQLSVPPSKMQDARNKSLAAMRAANLMGLPENELLNRIGQAEAEAVTMYTHQLQQMQLLKLSRMM